MIRNFTRINSLHPELLAQIFSLVVHETISAPTLLDDDVFGTFPRDSSEMGMYDEQVSLSRAVVLSGVCRYWRSVSLRASSLWTYTAIILSSQHIQRTLDSVPVWLGRARTAPLDIYLLTWQYTDTPVSKTMLDQVIPRLPFGNKQIHRLYLSLPSTSYLNSLLKTWFRDGVSNTLTKLDIEVYNATYDITDDITDELSTLQDWLSQCQELQVLRLNARTLCSDCFPAMPKLVDLRLFSSEAPITTTQLANIFRACPNLQRVKLFDLEFHGTNSVDLPPVPLQNLEVLSIQLLDVTRALPLISSKSSSVSLSVTHDMEIDSDRDLVDQIIDFSRRSTITALELSAEEIESGDFCRLIPSLPHLQILSLQECYLDDLMVRALLGENEPDRTKDAGSSTSPALHTIWLTDSTFGGENTVRSLVSLRRLKQLKLDHCFLDPSGKILEAKELCEYLLGAVSDLRIMNYDNNRKPAYFP